MIGAKFSPILEEIENALWEFEIYGKTTLQYTDEGFRAATKIFMSALMDKMWNLQEAEGMNMADRGNMATKAGEDLRNLIKTYTNIDTHKLYK